MGIFKTWLDGIDGLEYLLEGAKSDIPKRPLGKTGHQVSIFSLGGQGSLETQGGKDNCIEIIQTAFELGINYMDTSPIYGPSEDYYGEAIQDFRKKIFLASKTDIRTYDGSMKLLERSLKRLKTDYLDLWQLHHVDAMKEINQITGEDGALKALIEMKEQGVVKNIGFTGHERPKILMKLMDRHDFDTVLCPVNAADLHMNPPFLETVVPAANKKKMGVIGMKVFSQGFIFNKNGLTTAWAPLTYALSQPVSTLIVGCDSVEQLRENVAIAKAFKKLSPKELKEIVAKTKKYKRRASFFRSVYGGYDSREELSDPIQIIPAVK